jgi:hypothetical protein
MKLYFDSLGLIEFISFPFYFLLFFLLSLFIAIRMFKEDLLFFSLYYLAIYVLHSALLIIDYKFDVLPFFPDTLLYSNALKGDQFSDGIEKVALGYILFAKPIYQICLNSFLNYSLFNLMLFNASSVMFLVAFRNLYGKVKINTIRINFLLMAVMPSVILYSLTPLREPFIVFSFALFVLGLSQKRPFNYITCISIIITILLRPQIIVFYAFIYMIMALVGAEVRWRRLLYSSLLIIPVYLIINFISLKLVNIEITPEKLSQFRNFQRTMFINSGVAYPEVSWSNWFQVLSDLPGLFLQFLVAPVPVIVFIDFWTKYFYFADSLLVLFLLGVIVFRMRYVLSRYKLWMIIFIIFVLLNSIFEYHLYSAVRHRLAIVMFLIPLVSTLISKESTHES